MEVYVILYIEIYMVLYMGIYGHIRENSYEQIWSHI